MCFFFQLGNGKTINVPIMTAADGKICVIFLNFCENKVNHLHVDNSYRYQVFFCFEAGNHLHIHKKFAQGVSK